MEQWISDNPAVVLLVFGVLFAACVVAWGIIARREVERLNRLEKMLSDHIAREDLTLEGLVADVASLKAMLMPRSPVMNGEFHSLVRDLREVLSHMKRERSR